MSTRSSTRSSTGSVTKNEPVVKKAKITPKKAKTTPKKAETTPENAETTPNMDDLLLTAAHDNKLDEVRKLLDEGGDPTYQEDTSGMSVLMAAASTGNCDMITLLLENGAVWNALDRKHECAGDYAVTAKHQVMTSDE